MQVSVIFRITMAPDSTEMSRWSPSLMLKSRRVSAGMTILPRSSIFLAIPESMVLGPAGDTTRDVNGHVGHARPLASTRDVG